MAANACNSSSGGWRQADPRKPPDQSGSVRDPDSKEQVTHIAIQKDFNVFPWPLQAIDGQACTLQSTCNKHTNKRHQVLPKM